MKVCPSCKLEKSLYEYHKGSAYCKPCAISRATSWNKLNKVRRKEISLASDKKYREEKREKSKAYRIENRDKLCSEMRERKLKNRPLYNFYENLRRAGKLQATPTWANLNYIKLFYFLAKEEEQRIGKKIHVDHIVPLKSKFVCGLHNEFNLQLITQEENARKLNSWWPNMEERNLK